MLKRVNYFLRLFLYLLHNVVTFYRIFTYYIKIKTPIGYAFKFNFPGRSGLRPNEAFVKILCLEEKFMNFSSKICV